MKAAIQLKQGRWWINGKEHKHCNEWEQSLYNSFFRLIRRQIDNGKIALKNLSEHQFYVLRLGSGAEVLQDHHNGKVTFDVMI